MAINRTPLPDKAFLIQCAATLALAVIVLAAYQPALGGGFVWDDDTHLTANTITRPDGLRLSWTSRAQPNYWPLTWTAFWVQWQLWGRDASGYHLVNVVLHALNAFLLWRILRRLRVPGSWIAAVIFAVHPVNVECVAWITQMKTLLCALLWMVTLRLWIEFDDSRRRGFLAAAFAAFLAAMLSKPAVVAGPFALLLIAWWRRRRLTRTDIVATLPFLAVSLALGAVEVWFQYGRSIGDYVVRSDSLAARVAGAGWVFWFYLGKAAAPVGLLFVYPRWQVDASSLLAWLPLAGALAVFAAAWVARRAWGAPVLAALGYFALMIAPVAGLLNIFYFRYSYVADHYQYIAVVAPIALACAAGATLAARAPRLQATLVALAAAVVVLLAAASRDRSSMFEGHETLWRRTLQENPACWMGHTALGTILANKGQVSQAISHYEEAVRLNGRYTDALVSLGVLRLLTGSPQAAAELLRRATVEAPSNTRYRELLAGALGASADAATSPSAVRDAPNSLR